MGSTTSSGWAATSRRWCWPGLFATISPTGFSSTEARPSSSHETADARLVAGVGSVRRRWQSRRDGQPAVHPNDLPGYEGGAVGEQEADHGCHVVRRAQPAVRTLGGESVPL